MASFNFIAKASTNKQSEIKLNRTCPNLTEFLLIYNVIHYLCDFSNLFLDKVYLTKTMIAVPKEKCP